MSSASLTVKQAKKNNNSYYYRGEACLTKELVEDFGSKLVSSSSGFSLDESVEILSNGRLGYIHQLVQFGSIYILQN